MKPTLISALAGMLLGPAAVLANCGENHCSAKREASASCARKVCERKVRTCEKVALRCPVEKTHYRLVKSTQCVPKLHTKSVKDSCDRCAPARQITWTTFDKKTDYRWEPYVTTEYKTRFIQRCSNHIESPSRDFLSPPLAAAD